MMPKMIAPSYYSFLLRNKNIWWVQPQWFTYPPFVFEGRVVMEKHKAIQVHFKEVVPRKAKP